MSARGKEMPSRREGRASKACDFCRHRKMKCNNEKPECRNCKEHGRKCFYTELLKKPRLIPLEAAIHRSLTRIHRPSIAWIEQLEQENRYLQEKLSSLRGGIEVANNSNDTNSRESLELVNSQSKISIQPCKRPSVRSERPQNHSPTSLSSDATIVPTTFSPDEDSGYHGRTSAVFDEKSTETGISHHTTSVTKVPDVWIKHQLVAESSNQHQLETVNYLSGKLDFDGVDPELGMHLLSIYWNRQLSSGPIVYRTVFMRDMACAGPYFSKLLLNAIYFDACKYTSRIEVRQELQNKFTAGWAYRQRAVELLSKCFDKSNITTIQALLIMSSAIFAWCDEKSTSWLYAGMAFNMIIDLGIHVDAATLRRQISVEETEIRLRVFWAAYVIDKLQSLYQGRPACLCESGTNLPMKFLDEREELELFNTISYTEVTKCSLSPGYSVSTFIEVCKLSSILSRILQSLYTETSRSRDPDDLLQESNLLHEELMNWRKALPPHLDIKPSDTVTPPLPHTLSLLAMFNVLIILLHRPFVSEGHLYSTSRSIALDAFSKCFAAAFDIDYILKTYERSFCLKATPHIISYATYVSATIHVRLAAQRESGSEPHEALRRCLDVLDIHQTFCWSPKRAKRVIDRLVVRMGVVFDNKDSLVENSDLRLSDLDIDAIIETFTREQPLQTLIQDELYLPNSFDTGEVMAANSSSAFLIPRMATNNDLHNEQTMQLTNGHLGTLYDPIFGFNGSAFDDFDMGFGGSFF